MKLHSRCDNLKLGHKSLLRNERAIDIFAPPPRKRSKTRDAKVARDSKVVCVWNSSATLLALLLSRNRCNGVFAELPTEVLASVARVSHELAAAESLENAAKMKELRERESREAWSRAHPGESPCICCKLRPVPFRGARYCWECWRDREGSGSDW